MALQKIDWEDLLLSITRIEDCILEGIPVDSGYRRPALREVMKVARFIRQIIKKEIE